MKPRRRRIHEPLTDCSLCGVPAFLAQSTEESKEKQSAYQAGLRYERKIVDLLLRIYAQKDVEIISHPWISFRDATGQGFAQPDAVIIPSEADKPILVIEIKLSWTSNAKYKLQNFYAPLVAKIWGRPCATIMVYKNSRGKRAHKKLLSIHDFLTLKEGDYRECKYV